MQLGSPGSVLAAGSTSGHGHHLPGSSTANTPTVASSTHPPVTERVAAAPPPGRLTTLNLLERNCTSLSRVAVSSESATKMFAVADEQLMFGLNYWRNVVPERERERDSKQLKTNRESKSWFIEN